MNEMRIKFWCDAFKCAEGSIDYCTAYADQALVEFDERFPMKEERDYIAPTAYGKIERAKPHPDHYKDDDIPF